VRAVVTTIWRGLAKDLLARLIDGHVLVDDHGRMTLNRVDELGSKPLGPVAVLGFD